ncbi:peptide-methionine (R)-S-oxide reductase MsrB [Methylobacterium sp. BTF04]|uniref:peptide-methionine (R)-S-oxide reductase MsrB n=1 Tax=Methylobacterium sp. BTF04 TaxID=2708300 RepID=UPI0013CFD96A|nr:peptide-methionine (R)-S-oxide reductase MsrB [Methylobacterium sp. BTF04]NEU14931.1 peptide-methionine (R)-S-oxide reductase MsrB [Methylobacterium sp. BTF04]
MNRRQIVSAGIAVGALLAGLRSGGRASAESFTVMRSDAEWRGALSPSAYAILRGHGTERPGSSPLNGEKRVGRFVCAGCDLPLFSSDTKFESGTGWPSFFETLPDAVGTTTDSSLGMRRVEVHCRRCGGHLGHVFDDGPRPTGQRYCMNGAALRFLAA